MKQNLDERFTYGDYKKWPEGERWELIEGVAWCMSPAPMRKHQKLSGRLFAKIYDFLEGKPCKVYEAPFDVLMPEGMEADDEVDTVVQPDIVIFCDKSKLTDAGARGAPDIAVEILSPSTSKKDMNDKFSLYERRGVREYWVLDPAAWSAWIYRRTESGLFDSGELRERYGDRSVIRSTVLEGFEVEPERLFAELD